MTTQTAAAVAREAKQAASLAGWRLGGTGTAAAKAGRVGEATIRRWHRDDADYRAAVAEAIEEFTSTVGRSTHAALAEHVEAARAGELVLTKRGIEGGKPVEVYERVTLNPALARLALTRHDPRFTHPPKEVHHSGELSVWALLQAQADDPPALEHVGDVEALAGPEPAPSG